MDADSWDVLEELADDGGGAIVLAFKNTPSDGRLVVRPRGLRADATYDVRSIDVGPLGAAQGEVLMQDGVELVHAGGSAAHILILTVQ